MANSPDERVHPVRDLSSYLGGRWQIDRKLLDRRRSVCGSILGVAEFAAAGSLLIHREWGRLSFGNYSGAAEQRYDLEFIDTADRALVRFRDGRPFHFLDLSEGRTDVTHACGSDLYEGRFIAFDRRCWQSIWEISGPRKDQRIVTLYTRQTEPVPQNSN
jgi:hypothetical protein